MPFDDDHIPEQKKKIGMKLKNPSSIKFNPKEEFKKQISEINNVQDMNNLFQVKIAELTSVFFKNLEDKTLIENKSPPDKQKEKDLIDNLVKVSMEINNFEMNQYMENEDPLSYFSMGSSALINLLLNCLYFERNKINKLEYNLLQTNNKLKDVEVKLDKLKNDS